MPNLRRLLAATALAATASVLPVVAAATPAQAAPPAPATVLVTLADVDRNGTYGVYHSAPDGTGRQTILPESPSYRPIDARVSPSGTKVAIRLRYSTNGPFWLYVADLTSTGAANGHTVVAGVNTTSLWYEVSGFSWAANSQSLVFGAYAETARGHAWTLGRVNATGTPVRYTYPGSSGLGAPSLHANGRLVAALDYGRFVDGDGVSRIMMFDTVTRQRWQFEAHSVYALREPVWSPLGNRLAWTVETEFDRTGRPYEAMLATRLYSTPSSKVYFGLVEDRYSEDATFSPDGTEIWFDRYNELTSGPGDLFKAPITNLAAVTQQTTTTYDEYSATLATVDRTAPGAPTALPAVLNGTNILVRWTNPTARDLYRTLVWRTSGATTTLVYNGTGTSFTDPNRTVGETYTYTFASYDGALNKSAVVTRQVTALHKVPMVRAYNPTSYGSVGLPFAVSWAPTAANPAGAVYDVVFSYREGPGWAFVPLAAWQSGTTATWGWFGASGSPVTVKPGYTYVISARVRDAHGNGSAFSPYAKPSVPLNESAMAATTGWTTVNDAGHWLGTYRTTATNGAALSVAAPARQLMLVGDRCPTCGSIKIYVDGVYRGTVNTYAATTQVRRVLWASAAFPSIAAHRLTLAASVSGGRTVRVDGVVTVRS